MDSKLVVEQMSGRWQIKHPGLRPLAAEAADAGRPVRHGPVHLDPAGAEQARRRAWPTRRWTAARLPAGRPGRWPRRSTSRRPAGGGGRPPARAQAREVAARAATADRGSGRRRPPRARPGAEADRHRVTAAGAGPARRDRVHRATTLFGPQRRAALRTGRAQAAGQPPRRMAAPCPVLAAVLSSPLRRCLATAEAIAGALGDRRSSSRPDLVECDFGEWDGLTFAEVRDRRARTSSTAWLASTLVAPPGGESLTAGQHPRAPRAAAAAAAVRRADLMAVVSHVTPIKRCCATPSPPATRSCTGCIWTRPACRSSTSWPDGGVAVRTVNDTAHLWPSSPR